MSQYALRLPNSLFSHAKALAKKEHASLNQLFITAIAEKISAIETEDLLIARAKLADKKSYLNVLKKVKKRPPIAGDEI